MIKNASIQVAIKIKPIQQQKSVVKVQAQGKQLLLQLPGDQVQRVQVDMIHDANKTSQSIFRNCHIDQLVAKFIEGYNATILTYGQTGSGKTFAFEGDHDNPGIISEAVHSIYANRNSSAVLKCSFIELYNERIGDMLARQSGGQRGLKMRWQVQRQFVIEDLSEWECSSAEQMMQEWTRGNKNRVIASNKIHDYSSRSHSIFVVDMEDLDEDCNVRKRQVYFVDLAGSERVFSPVGRLSKEAIEINKSLFFLRKVIISLQEMNTQQKEQYVPYRDSKLTSILKRAFGGNCLTYLLACINPHQDYLEETLSTLQYALSAGRIHNQVNVNIDLKARQIRELRQEKQKLKKQLQMALLQIESFKSIERQEQLKRATNNEYANRIIECIGTVRELLKSNKELREELDKEKADRRKLALDMQQLEKNYKKIKKADNLAPVYELTATKHNFKQVLTPVNDSKGVKSRNYTSPDPKGSDRPVYSQSVDVFQRKSRGNTIVRRRKFVMHDKSDQSIPRL